MHARTKEQESRPNLGVDPIPTKNLNLWPMGTHWFAQVVCTGLHGNAWVCAESLFVRLTVHRHQTQRPSSQRNLCGYWVQKDNTNNCGMKSKHKRIDTPNNFLHFPHCRNACLNFVWLIQSFGWYNGLNFVWLIQCALYPPCTEGYLQELPENLYQMGKVMTLGRGYEMEGHFWTRLQFIKMRWWGPWLD